MCLDGPKEAVCSLAALGTGRVAVRLVAITTDSICRGIPLVGVVENELRVIEHVEYFSPELDVCFSPRLEGPQHSDIKVGAPGVVQVISSAVSLREAARCLKKARISQLRPERTGHRLQLRQAVAPDTLMGRQVRIGIR